MGMIREKEVLLFCSRFFLQAVSFDFYEVIQRLLPKYGLLF